MANKICSKNLSRLQQERIKILARLDSAASSSLGPSLRGNHEAQAQLSRVDSRVVPRNSSHSYAEAVKRVKEAPLAATRRGPKLYRKHGSWSQMMKGCCFRCTARDHLAKDCRDPKVCFRCRATSHITSHCSARNPLLEKKPKVSQDSQICCFSQLKLRNSKIMPSDEETNSSQLRELHKLKADESSLAKMEELRHIMIIQGDADLSSILVLSEIRRRFQPNQFTVTKLDMNRYQIIGPSVAWRDDQFRKGTFSVTTDTGMRSFKILKEAKTAYQLDLKVPAMKFWVRLLNVPYGWRT